MTLEEAYTVCRQIARKEAKNFYYAFRVLPKQKRDAMCAVYAFMRKADDLADDEAISIVERRVQMSAWLEAWHEGDAQDAVFIAVRDVQTRFGISSQLLEQLVQGTAMDLEPAETDGRDLHTFRSFEELYRYCYLVASVVGLVCIRIFGYSDPRAEKLAEETGIAFQLTNILRDVKEDVERERIYLPLDLLEHFSVPVERLRELAGGAEMHPRERAMLSSMAAKAEDYYSSAKQLMPLIDLDSRAALWVLVTIYHDLLRRIAKREGDVFSVRVSVPTEHKIWILAQGAAKALGNRLTV